MAALLLSLAFACSQRALAPSETPLPSAIPALPASDLHTVGKVVSVLDGVTIDVEIAGEVFRLRYLGVELPDRSASDDGGRSMAERALQFNRFKVLGRMVELEGGGVDSDDGGRILRYVYVDGEMVNKAMLTGGFAVVAEFPRQFVYRGSFLEAQESARADRRGYWQASVAPAETGETAGAVTSGNAPPPQFEGGTLPRLPGDGGEVSCDFSSMLQPMIKGNVEARTGERVYLVPSSLLYATTEVDRGDGDRWFCTEAEALAAGWARAAH